MSKHNRKDIMPKIAYIWTVYNATEHRGDNSPWHTCAHRSNFDKSNRRRIAHHIFSYISICVLMYRIRAIGWDEWVGGLVVPWANNITTSTRARTRMSALYSLPIQPHGQLSRPWTFLLFYLISKTFILGFLLHTHEHKRVYICEWLVSIVYLRYVVWMRVYVVPETYI